MVDLRKQRPKELKVCCKNSGFFPAPLLTHLSLSFYFLQWPLTLSNSFVFLGTTRAAVSRSPINNLFSSEEFPKEPASRGSSSFKG